MTDALTIGVAQLATERTLGQNLEKVICFIGQARVAGCRVAVFPEGALHGPDEMSKAEIDAAVESLCRAAAENRLYVIAGLLYRLSDAEPLHNRLLVIDPDGHVVHTYDKLWGDSRFPNVPGPFRIDGISCCAIICADRWLRAVEELPVLAGAQIIFECSNNFDNEWIPDLGWYWYVPRAVRNGVYVVFCNTARERPGIVYAGRIWPGHGHSAVVAPDGRIVAAAGEEADRLLVAGLDLSQATRAEAIRRRHHPLLKQFWDVGIEIMGGAELKAPPFQPLSAPETSLTVAAAQIACTGNIESNLERMGRMIGEAGAAGADIVALPELAVTGAQNEGIAAADGALLAHALRQIAEMARHRRVVIVFGMPCIIEGKRYNSAYVINPAGELVTRYDQLVPDRPHLFAPGGSTRAMWFEVQGVPSVVTIGADALWSEIAELASVRGALVHVHLAHNRDTSEAAKLWRRQLWANLASFRTLTVTVNAAAPAGGGSAIWEDYHRASSGAAGGWAPHSAVRLAEAKNGEQLLCITQVVPRENPHYARVTGRMNPQMKAWYAIGAEAIYTK